MGAMTPPSRKSCYNFRVTKIDKVLDGDTIDVTIDLGFDLYKKERVRVAGVDTPEKRTRDLEEKALGIDATNWLKEKLTETIKGVEIGLGNESVEVSGDKNSDEIRVKNKKISFSSNNSGTSIKQNSSAGSFYRMLCHSMSNFMPHYGS